MKKIIVLLFAVLPMVAMAQQVFVVDVSVLSEKEDNERMGVVLQKDADTEAFYNLMMELKSHSDKMSATKTIADVKKRDAKGSVEDVMKESFAKLDELQKMGLVSEAEVQKMKAEMSANISRETKKDAEAMKMLQQDASQPGSSNPSALKEKIRSYCVGKRFFRSADKKYGMVVVSDKKADGKVYWGLMDATTGRMVIEPNRFDAVSADKEHGYFTKDGYAIAGLEGKYVLINKTGRVIVNNGYKKLGFYNDCKILKAANAEWKVGIIDYQGNVLEPFVHSSFQSESLAKAANRIFKEKGSVKVEIW